MKKFIVAIALMLSATAAIAGPKFGNWEVDFENSRIVNVLHEAEYTTNVTISKDGVFSAFIYPKNLYGSGFDSKDIVNSTNTIMVVNGTRVHMQMDINHNNVMRISTRTEKGDDFITSEFWSKRRVDFIANGNRFWISASGVQKAYRLLVEAGTAI